MRVLVCGGRNFRDAYALWSALDAIHRRTPISQVIHGGADGADRLGGEWAAKASIECRMFPADWRKHGKAAGMIRNAQMLHEGQPDLVVAAPGGVGTAHMKRIAEKADVQVLHVESMP